MIWRRSRRDVRESAVLDRAVAAWRGAGRTAEVLGGRSRARILDVALDPLHDPAAPASLFVPARRLAMAGVLPALLGAALLLLLGHAGNSWIPATAHVDVLKRDGQVVFRIANGDRSHYVCKSTVPHKFDCGGGVLVRGGAYVDAQTDGNGIVFYRID